VLNQINAASVGVNLSCCLEKALGKSTLLNLIGGIDTPSSGTIRFDQRDLTALKERERTCFGDNISVYLSILQPVADAHGDRNICCAGVEQSG
jgi:ABC-type thiamine transport system ATPase subunit